VPAAAADDAVCTRSYAQLQCPCQYIPTLTVTFVYSRGSFNIPDSSVTKTFTLNEEVLLPLLKEQNNELFQYPHAWTKPGNIQAFTTYSGTRSVTGHFTVPSCWGCTMSVWHAWEKGKGHLLLPLPPLLHLSLPHSPPKPETEKGIINLSLA